MGPARQAHDRVLAEFGQPVVFRRRIGTGSLFTTVTANAVTKGFAKSRSGGGSELVGSIAQAVYTIIVSPTQFERARGWPGVAGGPRLPRKGDQAVADGRAYTIENCDPVKVGSEVVRLVIQVKG